MINVYDVKLELNDKVFDIEIIIESQSVDYYGISSRVHVIESIDWTSSQPVLPSEQAELEFMVLEEATKIFEKVIDSE